MSEPTIHHQSTLVPHRYDPLRHQEKPKTRYLRARRFAYELLHSPEVETKLEHYVRGLISLLIGLSVAAVVLESVKEIHDAIHPQLYALEWFSVGVFTIEYLMRLWSVIEMPKYRHPIFGRIRYIFTFHAIIDLVAVLPFYLPRLISADLLLLRGLRLLRLLRVLKLGRYSVSLGILARVFTRKREELVVSLLVISLILLISSSLMYYLEHEAQPEAFPNIPAALWWGVATLTTVGYGDVYPITAIGKFCAAIIAILSIGLVALPSGIIVSGFVEEMHHRQEAREQARHQHDGEHHHEGEVKRCPHCGQEL
jgi:voltage-gated potassium channel